MTKLFSLGIIMQKRNPSDIIKDMIGGIIVALVSIPISMGYAQIAGLPMQYGLYGSVIPILLFGMITTTKDFVFGVDAAPAALTGAAIASMGIAPQSERAAAVVPAMAFLTACCLMVFRILKAGRIVRYISRPVMAGFISGICCTIILMQIPKLFGGAAGTGEAPELIAHIITQLHLFNPVSFIIGTAAVAIIVVFRRIFPKVPMSVVMMAIGACLTIFFDIKRFGVLLLPEVNSGFGSIHIISGEDIIDNFGDIVFASLSIAAVIMAESLLASRGNAMKDGYRLDENREILAYSIANLASAVSGCCPVNGSVSRTGIVRQFGAKSQWMSFFAALTMAGVLLSGTIIIGYLPVPVLTAIVISALMGACEFDEAAKLIRTSRKEFFIFAGAFLGVLIFGTVYGVMIGIVLSFASVAVSAVTPPRSLMGIIPGRTGFFSLTRHDDAVELKNVVIYRFGGNLFFANAETFISDIENAVRDDTRLIVIHAAGISSIDTTAADRLETVQKEYEDKGIPFVIAENHGELEDCLLSMHKNGIIDRNIIYYDIEEALSAYGFSEPYETKEGRSASKKTDLMQGKTD